MRPTASSGKVWPRRAAEYGGVAALCAAILFARMRTAGRPMEREGAVPTSRVIGDADDFVLINDLKVNERGLWVLDADPDAAIKLVDLETMRIKERGAKTGKGPGEVTAPFSFQVTDDRITIVDPGTSGSDDFEQTAVRYVRQRRVPHLHFQEELIGDTVIANGFMYPALVRTYTVTADREIPRATLGKPPVEIENVIRGSHLNRSFMAVDRWRRRIAVGFVFLDRLDVWTFDGEYVGAKPFSNAPTPPGGRSTNGGPSGFRRTPDMRWGYVDVEAAGAYVLGLYSGKTERERPSDHYTGNELRVFNWNGEPVKKFMLSQGVTAIAYDSATAKLYGAQVLPYPAVLVFELNLDRN